MLWAVIMAGGAGTRFWPESRRKLPKQFLRFFGSKTLLEETVARLRDVVPASRTIVITSRDKVALSRKLLKKVPAAHILGEPVGRNTAPCAALAAAIALRKDPEAVIALLPADHHIGKPGVFRRALRTAFRVALKSRMPVTFGIKPAFAHTGYGYLEMGPLTERPSGAAVYRLKRFHEKPDGRKAAAFLRSGKFLWNSGMFVWRADEVLKATARYQPEIDDLVKKILGVVLQQGLNRWFAKMPSISIDYGLMEKMKGRILTMPVDFGWNDVGGWQSLADLCRCDREGNVVTGKALLVESAGNIVRSGDRLVALLGMKDHVVVDTPDALLVCPRGKTESIRRVVETLRQKKLDRYL
ncbi:MAG: sugar phosphate nucleotidyltransferase [Candidatus Omnitrophica bacterium]|nr:sugar phosphate nucleotidyltransferase [Candidatus Omnitrophota bacterium]